MDTQAILMPMNPWKVKFSRPKVLKKRIKKKEVDVQ
jgi:hypothetical protein